MVTRRSTHNGMRLLVDVAALNPLDDIQRFQRYTQWLRDWGVFDTNQPAAPMGHLVISGLERYKPHLTFKGSRVSRAHMMQIHYTINDSMLEKTKDPEKKEEKRRAFRALIISPLKYYIDKKYPERKK
jgi:hypothetical protein